VPPSEPPWPPATLSLRTPRLELRPDDDDGLDELMAEALRGVHDPAVMPFAVAWTDQPPADLVRSGLQHYWSARAALTARDWTVNFLVRLDGAVIGTQALFAREFADLREVASGSWLGRRFQGRGLGTEMRSAVLQFAFDRLGATAAITGSFTDNLASLGVSRRLGYRPNGTVRRLRRGVPATEQLLRLTADDHARHRPDWRVRVHGLTPRLRALLGAA
jgi:RimJ/RimL family protein N-acetyltransferase